MEMQNDYKKLIPFELSDYVLKNYFLDKAENQNWIDNEKISVAVSGGGDSIALLFLCHKFFRGRITAIHINHGIRGQESNNDEKFTRDFANNIGVDFVSVNVSVPDERLKGESIESAARRLRHEKLCVTAKNLGINTILLGHNRDDLAETVLFNLLRGTGIRGSVGMTEITELNGIKFCRPLLGLRREFLRDILRVRNITWCEDSTNNDDKYTRNFIRLNLLPMIEENINSSAVEHLAEFGEDMRKIRDDEDKLSIKIFNDCMIDDMTFDRKKLKLLSENDTALFVRELGRRFGAKTLSRDRCNELVKLINKSGTFIFQWNRNFTINGIKHRIIIIVNNYE